MHAVSARDRVEGEPEGVVPRVAERVELRLPVNGPTEMATSSGAADGPEPQTGMSRKPSTWTFTDMLELAGRPLTVSSVVETACTDGLNG